MKSLWIFEIANLHQLAISKNHNEGRYGLSYIKEKYNIHNIVEHQADRITYLQMHTFLARSQTSRSCQDKNIIDVPSSIGFCSEQKTEIEFSIAF